MSSQFAIVELGLVTSVPPSIFYNMLLQRFKPVLDKLNSQNPLASELPVNPFRYLTDLDPEPMFLVHAVAFAGHHVKSTSSQNHRYAALQRLHESLKLYRIAGD
ncbi:hypothetical protein EYZ11_005228 [Aspergillus tanneri]|uniref:Uncharacterized protein n=1 Tax=Aspergillus tanneri TaxID=1220188 RepID=A0A4S3JKY9_9EURO|nr:hypothetical protein EYZ11_005228 [Aspergillus tanneri]